MERALSSVLVFSAVASMVVGCGRADPPLAVRPLPGVGLSVDGAAQAFGNAPLQRPSIIRYDFSGSSPALADAQCSTALVDGDPLHWKVLCPAHPYLSAEEEFRVDAQGYVLFHSGSFTRPQDRPGYSITRFDEAGMPLQATIAAPEMVHPRTGVPIAGSGNQTGTWAYDARERLVHIEYAIVGMDGPFATWDVTYDDANRRILYRATLNLTAVLGEPMQGESGGYDLFDDDLRRVESHWSVPGTDSSSAFAYDSQGRLLTTIAEVSSKEQVVQYVERRIYE